MFPTIETYLGTIEAMEQDHPSQSIKTDRVNTDTSMNKLNFTNWNTLFQFDSFDQGINLNQKPPIQASPPSLSSVSNKKPDSSGFLDDFAGMFLSDNEKLDYTKIMEPYQVFPPNPFLNSNIDSIMIHNNQNQLLPDVNLLNTSTTTALVNSQSSLPAQAASMTSTDMFPISPSVTDQSDPLSVLSLNYPHGSSTELPSKSSLLSFDGLSLNLSQIPKTSSDANLTSFSNANTFFSPSPCTPKINNYAAVDLSNELNGLPTLSRTSSASSSNTVSFDSFVSATTDEIVEEGGNSVNNAEKARVSPLISISDMPFTANNTTSSPCSLTWTSSGSDDDSCAILGDGNSMMRSYSLDGSSFQSNSKSTSLSSMVGSKIIRKCKPGRKPKPRPTDPCEIKKILEDKRRRNTEAARKSRQKRIERYEDMEVEIESLRDENKRLKEQIELMKKEMQRD